MYAVPVRATFSDRSAADANLDQVVSQVSGMPGFVAGYWVVHSADQGISLIMFDSEEAAQGFANFLKTAPDLPGVMLDRENIVVGEVLAHA